MITIKEFASLCGCSTQTLRYYDKIDLLKPVKVDQRSGYRYYTKSQAIDFVKIKNLQAADFTIDEIKVLLRMSDKQVYEAFDRKVAEQTQKLERIKEIQQSYLTEKSNMEKLIQNLSDYLFNAVSDYSILREFGLSPDEGPAIVAKLRDYIEKSTLSHLPNAPDVYLTIDDQVFRGANRVADALAVLKDKGYDSTVLLGDEAIFEEEDFTPEDSEVLWVCDGWKFVYEFIDSIPPMDARSNYCFYFKLTEDKYGEGLEFPMFMIAAMLPKIELKDICVGCSVNRSDDGQNHFRLLRGK